MAERYQLDARRLLCPLPVIRTQNKMKHLQPGAILDVICTDPGALNDIPAWCRMNGHEVIATSSERNEFVITIKVC